MNDKLRKALKTLYRKDLSGIRVPPVPRALATGQRRTVGRRRFFLGWSAAACIMMAGILFVSLSPPEEGGLARLITETGRKYEWQKYVETGNRNEVNAFVNAFTRHF
jgi:ferric-dicitrate binding protein FerR (iron transport regulator)